MDSRARNLPFNISSLLDGFNDVAVWAVSDLDSFDYLSDGVVDIWGIEKGVLRENPDRLLEAVHEDDRKKATRIVTLIEKCLEGGPDSRIDDELCGKAVEHRVVQPNGDVRWVSARVIPDRDEVTGDIEGVVGISTDITEQKEKQKELAVLNQIVRHDIRNDMTVIVGWLNKLERDLDDGKYDTHIEYMSESSDHILELTRVTRDFIDIVGDEEIVAEPMALRPFVEKQVDQRRKTYPKVDIGLSLPDRGNSVYVEANEKLGSVLTNLINNAIQHNDSDEPIVRVWYEVFEERVEICVADNGPGVPDDKKDIIFGRGKQGMNSTGSGFGLYVVDMLVKEFDGNVWVEDGDNGGAVFRVQLPRVVE